MEAGFQPRAFPLLDAINAATGDIMANGGIQGFQALPRDPRNDTAFGPMDPLTPEAIDQLDNAGHTEPRSWQYPVGWNLPGAGQRETPWQVLRAAASGIGIIRRCIEVRKKHVCDLRFVFAPSEDAINDAYQLNPGAGRLDAEQKLREELLPEINRLREFWANPWRSRSWDFKQWCRAVLEAVLVDDATPIYPHRTYGGDVYDLELIDGATIKPLLDSRGNQPSPPFPAFQQSLYGFPRGEWAASTEYDESGELVIPNGFQSPQLMYYVSNPRSYSPYGLSPVEQCLFDSRLYLQRQKWMIAEYDDGSTPMTWVETAESKDGQQMTLSQQRLWEQAFNSKLAGNTRARVRARVLPNGWKAMQMATTDERYKPEYDMYLIKLIASYFGVTATQLGFGETNGLGGAGFSDSQMAVTGELGLKPDTEVLTAIINRASCHFLGMDKRIVGMFVDPSEANGPEQAAVTRGKIESGQISINEGRQLDGQSLLPFEEANMPFILGGPQGIIFLEGAKAQIDAAMEQQQMAAATQALGTAGKLSMEEKKLEDGTKARQETHELARETRDVTLEAQREQSEVKKSAEIEAFRNWRRKPANRGDEPRRPFLFKSVEPDDGWPELDGLGPLVVDFDGWEWQWNEDIEKAAKKVNKNPFDYIKWNASPEGLIHPKGPNGRWVKRGSDLHNALIEEGRRHAKAHAPKTGAASGESTTLQGMSAPPKPETDVLNNPRHAKEWQAWATGPTRPIRAYTIPGDHDFAEDVIPEKHGAILPDRNVYLLREGRKVRLLDIETDEEMFTGNSAPDVWRKVSAFYGAEVEHEHEGTFKRQRFGIQGDPLTAPAAKKYGAKHVGASEKEDAARARQARIDAAKAKARLLAEVEEGILTGADSATLRRMTDQAVRRAGLESDPVAGHVQLNMDESSLNTAAAAWGLTRIDEGSGFDRKRHEAVGDSLREGQLAELVKPGYMFRDGDEELMLHRAVVDAKITEPERPTIAPSALVNIDEEIEGAERYAARMRREMEVAGRGRKAGAPGQYVENVINADERVRRLKKRRELAGNTEPEASPIAAPPARLMKPGRDSAGFVTSATNAHSLKRGDMVVVNGVPAHVVSHQREGNAVRITLDDGRTMLLALNEPVRRVSGGAAGGGGISKAAEPDLTKRHGNDHWKNQLRDPGGAHGGEWIVNIDLDSRPERYRHETMDKVPAVLVDDGRGPQDHLKGPGEISWSSGRPDWSEEEHRNHLDAVEAYRGGDFRPINRTLRGANIDFYDEDPEEGMRRIAEQVRLLDDIMNHSRLTDDVVVVRGTATGRGVFGEALNGDLVGHEWTEDSYTSTTANPDIAADFTISGLTMNIRVPKGTGALVLSGMTIDDGFDDEAEILLERGVRMRVVSDTGPGMPRQLEVEVLPRG